MFTIFVHSSVVMASGVKHEESSAKVAVWSASNEAVVAEQWEKSGLMLIGEVHGTTQVPAFVGRLVELEAARHPIVLALERTDAETAALNAFLSSRGAPGDRRALSTTKGWSGGIADGRSSTAMLDLLDLVRRLRQSGKQVSVLLTEKMPDDMSVLQGPGAAQRYVEKSMAQTIRQSVTDGKDGTLVIGLMGSYHLRVANDGPYGASVAGQLNDLSPIVAFVDGTGSAWTCIDANCESHPFAQGSQMGLAGTEADRRVNGRLNVVSLLFKTFTASPPASGSG